MNDSRADYLKAIYEESIDVGDGISTNRALSVRLQVSSASVSEMISKLTDLGLTETIPYKGCKLTQNGITEALQIIRSHRLWEVFLIEHLNFTWSEAHEDAHLLEHATTKRMLDRLDEFLNYPKHCPHGSIIPKNETSLKKDGLKFKEELTTLNNLDIKKKAIVCKIVEEAKLLDYLWDLGLVVGKEIKIISKGEYEGTIILVQQNKEISISYKAATKIYVKQI